MNNLADEINNIELTSFYKHLSLLVLVFLNFSVNAQEYSFRKYNHVKKFYENITKEATKICLDNNIPPASLLAIAGLESGWGSGYVAQISGNFLSLGAKKSDVELPALYLPTHKKTGKIIFDSLEIVNYSKEDLLWKKSPKSLKKDYRPKPIRGITYQLGYFKHHPKEKVKANLQNMTDFVTTFISRKSSIKAYRVARKKMDDMVKIHGKEILLKKETAIIFVNEIGGKVNSYNFRKTWPIKVIKIINKVGLHKLTYDIYKGKSFNESW